jgi:hypothetical protein
VRCERELEDLMGGKAKLVFLRGEVRAHAHAESAVGRLRGGTTNGAYRVWGGRWVGIVRVIKCKSLNVRSRGKERLVPRGIRDGGSEGIAGNDLRHGEGEEATLWRV